MERMMVRKRSARRDDSYEENVTDTDKRSRRTMSVSIREEILYSERDWQRRTPDSSTEIAPDLGLMRAIPRPGGDSTAEPDA